MSNKRRKYKRWTIQELFKSAKGAPLNKTEKEMIRREYLRTMKDLMNLYHLIKSSNKTYTRSKISISFINQEIFGLSRNQIADKVTRLISGVHNMNIRREYKFRVFRRNEFTDLCIYPTA
jgi:hypothetical protein